MTTKTRLVLVGLALTAGLVTLLGVALWTLEQVRVNGPLYSRIVRGKDLIADILPPPEYAIEAHDAGLRIAREPDARRRAELAENLRALSKDFDERHDFWRQELEPGPMRDQMEENYRSGRAYLDEILGSVVPARMRGEDASGALARAEGLFEAHRKAVLALVSQATDRNKADEESGRDIIRARVMLLVAVALVVIAIGVTMSILAARQVGRGIGALVRATGALGDAVGRGDLDHRAALEAVPAEFAPIVQAMNRTMDAFVRPVRLSTSYLVRVAAGETPPPITDSYEGEFDEVKKSWNHLIEVMEQRSRDVSQLLDAARAGRLDARADASRYQGQNAVLIQGINALLETVAVPLQEIMEVMGRLAERDLRARMHGEYAGDLARAKEAINATASALHEALSQVARAVGQISSASSQIASSAQAVASGASEQASTLEETGSSLETMSNMTRHATDSAQQAAGLAAAAKGSAAAGSAAMEQMTGAMTKIKTSAEGTSQIIKDINEIAFQTNLLALNAAVEAARAGEAGRGFAVVAEEVRSLALRSKEAANKTEELIRQSVKEAADGEVTAGQVSAKLSEIVTSISKATDIVSEIAASAKEQSSSIEQISTAMNQISSVTQQNAAGSEESSSAAAEMSSQAQELAEMVNQFQFNEAVTRQRATPAKVPVPSPARAPAGKGKGAPKNGHGGIPLRMDQVASSADDLRFKGF
jgi:methyl-accepting chemotaxis protein